MRTYRYANQYRKVKKSYALEAFFTFLLTFYIGLIVLSKTVFAITPDQLYLESLSFGTEPALNINVETSIAGTSAIIVPPKTKEEIIQSSNHPKELDLIWKNESSRGKNNIEGSLQKYCEDQGKSNEFGYGGMQNKWCYDSFAQAAQVVDQWLDKQTDASLCYYNQGIRTSDCNYVK